MNAFGEIGELSRRHIKIGGSAEKDHKVFRQFASRSAHGQLKLGRVIKRADSMDILRELQ